MKLKQVPEDFIVDELYNLEELKQKDEGTDKKYHYFILKKTNYTQMRAVEVLARAFNTSKKLIYFAGTKDKSAITTQLIAVMGIKESNLEKNIDYINVNIKDISVEYLGVFNSRINLGDNLGNKFSITLRDLDSNEIGLIHKNIDIIRKEGVPNYFGSQRFGFANNSHLIGIELLKENFEQAIKLILTALPQDPSPFRKNIVDIFIDNWEQIKSGDTQTIQRILENMPRFMKDELKIINYLKNHTNDFLGAFRTLHKKQQTLYIYAFQSYIFNRQLNFLIEHKFIKNFKELPLITFQTKFKEQLQSFTRRLLQEVKISFEDLQFKSMPEIHLDDISRLTLLCIDNLSLSNSQEDDLFEGKNKLTLKFTLEKGAYATTIVDSLLKS